MARRLNASQVRAGFAEAVNRANFAGERTVIRRHSKDVAAVVSVEDLKTLEALEDRPDLEEARQIMKKPGRLIPWEKVKSMLSLGRATPSPGPPRLEKTPGRATLSPKGERAGASRLLARRRPASVARRLG
jgi:PHD/YefM family antitoxin component YafN of YafNO toxin-antitoxin module